MEIKVQNISKTYSFNKEANNDNLYNYTKALNNITTTFKEGEITALLGRNGSGKSTLISIISNRRIPDEGTILIDNQPSKDNYKVLQELSVVSQEESLHYIFKNTKTILNTYKKFYKNFDIEYFNNISKHFKFAHDGFSKLSTGYENIFKSLITLSTNSKIMIFDEPTLGLSPANRDEFYKVLVDKYFELNNTIIISTHLINEVSTVAQNICVLDKGELVYEGTTEDFVKPHAPLTLQEAFINVVGDDNND